MRRSSRTTSRVVAAAIAVVALAAAGPAGAAAKPRHGGHHGHGHHGGSLSIKKEAFGAAGGTAVDRYTLANGSMSVSILTYGGIIQELWAPDRRGRLANITLGYKDLDGYTAAARRSAGPPTPRTSAAIIGRYGNRIGNAAFSLDGNDYTLDANNGPNSLHGGDQGFDRFVWDAEPIKGRGRVGLTLTRTSAEGEGCANAARRLHGLSRQPRRHGRLHARQAQQPAHRLHGDDGRADGREPHQPRVLEPGGRGHGDDLRPPPDAQRRRGTRRSTRR